jgi:hypothetical protein
MKPVTTPTNMQTLANMAGAVGTSLQAMIDALERLQNFNVPSPEATARMIQRVQNYFRVQAHRKNRKRQQQGIRLYVKYNQMRGW